MISWLGLVGLIGFLTLSEGQVIQTGQCDTTVTVQANFDITQFAGVWYENSRTPNDYQNGDCSTFDFTEGNGQLTVRNEAVNRNIYEEANGTATYTTADPARMVLTISTFPNAIDFWVITTDYVNYALLYSCENVGTNRAINLWKMGRSSTYISDLVPALMDASILNNFGIVASEVMVDLEHSDNACYALPVIATGLPVVIPGQCDENIAVVQGFDAGRFVGRWHEISSYFSESATGTCPTANYAANADGTVAVINTQVVNQTLEAISGFATVASVDGSGVLDVTLEVIPNVFAVQRLYVIATDYDNYAITYSCVNSNQQEKRVYSWIVSRTKELPAASAAAIQDVVDSILDLNNQYYTPADQSDDGCFFYPEHVINQPVVFPGSCDQGIPAMANFNPVLYQGLWHEIEAYPSLFQQGTCNNAFYTLNDAGFVDVFNTQVVNQSLDEIYGIATVASDDGSAKLEVTFPVEGTNFNVSTSYWVLDTDYESYALVYTCEDLADDQRAVWSWKLSRTKQLDQAASTVMDNIINTIPVLDTRYFQNRDQSVDGCYYIPEAVSGQQVVFPGQCDDSIAAVPNFNLTQFQGTWYKIEAYPKEDQPGQCISHEYSTTTTNTLNLVSNQIIDQFQYVSNGSLGFNSTDGTGRMTISIISGGEVIEIPFWILSTDYTGYALAYSCVNLNEDFRGIFSWKLSRTRELTATANTAINTAITTIDVIDNIYFETTDHSDEACFFLPELETGEPVILVGQCDLTIPAVQNFDAARYTGYWRLLESYPSAFQTGGCHDATYTLMDGFVSVFNTQVLNQTLDTMTGTAVVSSTDGTGKLAVTFPVVGTDTTVTLEYWILATDYDSYALVYSCMNINAEQRQIWSWKLSRSREFSAEAYANMNDVINTVNVLNNRYYDVIDHSDEECFYFPEPTGQAVIFRGQCDTNITTVPGFDAVAYMGLWHEIQGYPSEFQQGSCNNAFYTLDAEAGVVEVYNTQVIGQTLFDIYGQAIPVSDDGKLEVTFPVEGTNFTVQTSYWVLATDYDSYALVYTCENINEEYRAVWSWKLSRDKSLAAAANTVMDAVIENIQVLDDRYYEAKDQSAEGCFYFPEVTGEPVEFPGVCDTNIATVANLDLNRFSGLWYEVSAYPKDDQLGTCVNYDFSVTSNLELGLISTQVIGLDLDITNASIIRTSADNSAFTITLNINGTEIQIPYWILDTDYDNYALAYSCVNLGNERRGVYSWKLSRTKDLSAASNTAIASAIANIDVLQENYFITTGQSDEDCFYLPDISLNEPVIFPGQCDDTIPTMQNFDPFSYQGQWYDIESYYDAFQDGTCNDALYTVTPAGVVDVYNTQVVNQTLDTISGVAETTDESGKLIVTFPVAGTDFTITTTYWILSTDYESYSLVYSCTNLTPDTRRVYSWKLSRTRTLTEDSRQAIDAVVNQVNVLDDRYFITRDHSDDACFYYPEFVIGQAVTFRGQCDESIQAVANFDVAAYTGFWYDVGSYPQEFQFGSCPTATYTLNADLGVVEVYNTQVTNQTLDFINGIAAVDPEANGTGRLLVTFPIAGTDFSIVSPYWVLATDYNNYALVYACMNMGPERRRVTSWKLSRQPTLTAGATTAINTVIDSIQVLDDRYYQDQSHTEDSCFYYPEAVMGQPVVFPGTCDDTIQAVPDFDLQRFAGLWHEAAAYPKMEQAGQCINYEFTNQSATTLGLTTSQVIGLDLDISYGSLVRTSTDNSGRFTITINVNNTDIVIPYWVVATDYDNYALAYSCVNYDNGYRGVWSWKLSREQQLSAFSETAISQTIDTIEVLDNRYYELTDQADDACFYLPDISNTEPAIFPGQCDQNLPAVANFDPERYQGRWYDVASYYDEFQMGTCNDAEYTLNAAGVVDVFNTQVVNEVLDTITGTAVLASTDGSGKLLVTFPVAGTDFTIDAEYWVLDTDYDNYSLVYSCSNYDNNSRRVFSWKLSRSRQLEAAADSAINDVISRVNVLDNRYYIQRNHSEEACFYYPDPVPGQAVTFRGQCDENVAGLVVQNFDVLRYTGLWYDVGSYPQAFQFGSCPTATYTFNETGGFVEVYNTQVVNQQLDDIYGEARVASTDGSAQLTVTFPIAGTNLFIDSPYWVLATDYDDYALVYACMNTGVESYRVTSWKLSRQQTISATAAQVFTQTFDNVKVLDERYFVNRGHSEDDCFFYPDNEGGPVYLEGECDANQTVVANFNAALFSGTWYEQSRFPSELQEGECSSSNLEVSGQEISITQTIVYGERLETVQGVLTIPGDGSGALTATFSTSGGVETLPVYVLDTDYTSYALLFSCRDNVSDGRKQVFSWKLSRAQAGLPEQAVQNINTIVSSNVDLFDLYYDVTDQTNNGCFYYPVLDDDAETIVLPGPCDESIQGVANFDAAGYLGRWFEISAYPAGDTQIGQCARAEYSLGETGVDVYHTVVYDQTLEVVTGVATVATSDGSGVLDVVLNLPFGDVFANYYILATDYTNYALVYSCRNQEDGNRQVTSWKLSRQPTLDPQFDAIMSPIIESTQGLLQEYYQPTSQADEDCFYIPELIVEDAVVFRGQCADITGIDDFDVQRYLGWWHEIAAYPTGTNNGNCRSSQIEENGSQFTATDISVFGELEFTYIGSNLEVTSNGRLRRVGSNGEYSDVWVLATDYETYSLLYSCENINDEYRRVWSGKHSKSRSLNVEAETIMQETIQNNEVLVSEFYLPVDQSDQACFHYPEQTGRRIIIPGQCDEDIPVVANFDAASYTGIWYQIEKYPQQWESGSCVGARYTLDEENGVVEVINWEVIDGELDTIEGTGVVSSTDGSAKLLVTLPVVGTNDTTDYPLYVLSTDYITYSLAYSCENINEYQRAIGAWKLSRTRVMPSSGTTAITSVISQRPELHDPYFEVTDQNEDCLEPSSGHLAMGSTMLAIVCAVWQLLL